MRKKERDIEEYKKMEQVLENSSVEELERTIIEAYQSYDEELIAMASSERKYKIIQTFEWTPEKKAKLLRLNDELMACFEKLRVEGNRLIVELNKRVADPNDPLDDYEIEGVITPYIYSFDENGKRYTEDDTIESILTEYWEEYIWQLGFSHEPMDETDDKFDNSLNWNTDPWLNEEFLDVYLCNGIHSIYDHTNDCHWSMSDILRINHLWARLKVEYQMEHDIR